MRNPTEYMRLYMARRRREDPAMRLRHRLQSRLRRRCAGSAELLGCSLAEAARALPTENGEHIDHIIPCSRFDLTDANQQRACFNAANLQVLPARVNLGKSARLPTAVTAAEQVHGVAFWRRLPFEETTAILRGLRAGAGVLL